MNKIHLYDPYKTCESVVVVTDMTSEQFNEEMSNFLCNKFQDNKGLTVDIFAQRMVEKGYKCEVIIPTELVHWWGDSFITE